MSRDSKKLFECITYAYLDTMKRLLEDGVSVQELDDLGRTPLDRAIRYNLVEFAELLLEYGALISKDAIFYTIERNNIKMLECLIHHGIDFSVQNDRGFTPLVQAVRQESPEIIKLLIASGAANNKTDYADALMYAYINSRPSLKELIVADNTISEFFGYVSIGDLDRVIQHYMPDFRNYALCIASNYGHLNLVKFFLRHNADINFSTIHTPSPLFLAINCFHNTIAFFLLDNGAHPSIELLELAAKKENSSIVKALLAHCYSDDKEKTTALIIAAQKGNVTMVKLLLENGINIDVHDRTTALLEAIKEEGDEPEYEEIVKLLLKNNAHVNLLNQFGDTALSIACHGQNSSIINLLLKHKADVNLPNGGGDTPLINACSHGNIKIVKLLLKYSASVNQKCNGNDTPLLVASNSGYTKLVTLLLEHGADIHARNQEGATSLILAASNGHDKVVKILLEHGATIDDVDSSGKTAIDYAQELCYKKIINFLEEFNMRLQF